jgi:hypothetical protein
MFFKLVLRSELAVLNPKKKRGENHPTLLLISCSPLLYVSALFLKKIPKGAWYGVIQEMPILVHSP